MCTVKIIGSQTIELEGFFHNIYLSKGMRNAVFLSSLSCFFVFFASRRTHEGNKENKEEEEEAQ